MYLLELLSLRPMELCPAGVSGTWLIQMIPLWEWCGQPYEGAGTAPSCVQLAELIGKPGFASPTMPSSSRTCPPSSWIGPSLRDAAQLPRPSYSPCPHTRPNQLVRAGPVAPRSREECQLCAPGGCSPRFPGWLDPHRLPLPSTTQIPFPVAIALSWGSPCESRPHTPRAPAFYSALPPGSVWLFLYLEAYSISD